VKKSFRAISLAVIVALAVPSVPALAAPKPTLAEIEAAKKVEAAKKKAADAQAKKLAAANQSLRTLTAKANAATALYRKAQAELSGSNQLQQISQQSMQLKLQQLLLKHIKQLESLQLMLTSWVAAFQISNLY
jgi:hypothetical protein